MAITPRFKPLYKALGRLQESLNAATEPLSEGMHQMIRDSIIKRFEFTMGLFWKCLKDELSRKHGLEVKSPKGVFKECFDQGMITDNEAQALVAMVDDRNDVAHEYEEQKADAIAKKAQGYKNLMEQVADRLAKTEINNP